jgi:hypothetical protein
MQVIQLVIKIKNNSQNKSGFPRWALPVQSFVGGLFDGDVAGTVCHRLYEAHSSRQGRIDRDLNGERALSEWSFAIVFLFSRNLFI